MKSASVDRKLSWFVQWNKTRAKYSHPEKGKVSEDEYQFLLNLKEWLDKNMRIIGADDSK